MTKDYAYLGDVTFQPLSVTGMEERYSYQFVEHQVIEGKPLQQYLGDNLDEITLSIRFHFSFCDPAGEMKKLKDAGAKHAPLVLQMSDGTIAGRMLITEIQKTTEVTADNGRALSIDVRVTLKEWYDPEPIKSRQQAQKQNAEALQGKGTVAKVPAPSQRALVAGGIKLSGSVIGTAANAMAVVAGGLSKVMSGAGPVIDQISAASAGISSQIGPMMQQAQGVAAGVQDASGMVQGYAANISGYSSSITRILSGLPGPAGRVGARIGALNSKISGETTKIRTLTSLVDGSALEANTRAQMVTRMLPK